MANKALLVGINRYKIPGADLNGCVNDVTNMRDILYDMDWDGNFISDDDLRALFTDLPKGVHLDCVLDSCHSGTGTREMQAMKGLPFELSFKTRFLPPPVDIACRAGEGMEVTRLLKGKIIMNHVLFAACQDDQTSADAYINGSYNGAFSYYLAKHVRDTQGDITRAELISRVQASLKFNGFSQVPQLECEAGARGKKVMDRDA